MAPERLAAYYRVSTERQKHSGLGLGTEQTGGIYLRQIAAALTLNSRSIPTARGGAWSAA